METRTDTAGSSEAAQASEAPKLTDAEKIKLLAETVLFAATYLKCDGEGLMFDPSTGKHRVWYREFTKRLRDCGFEAQDDAIDYARTPRSKRKGPEWKKFCEELKAKGYKIP